MWGRDGRCCCGCSSASLGRAVGRFGGQFLVGEVWGGQFGSEGRGRRTLWGQFGGQGRGMGTLRGQFGGEGRCREALGGNLGAREGGLWGSPECGAALHSPGEVTPAPWEGGGFNGGVGILPIWGGGPPIGQLRGAEQRGGSSPRRQQMADHTVTSMAAKVGGGKTLPRKWPEGQGVSPRC